MTETISTDGKMMTILFNEVMVQETNISGFFIMTINGRFLVYIYRPLRCGKVIFSQACVKNSVHRNGGVSASVHAGIHTPPTPRQTPPEADTPPPPTAEGYCCGRYASYWNAFLFPDNNCGIS